MAPIRRYLRITRYSVLECRIYLDNPALAQSWLLNPRHPVLPRVIEAVRPLVLPKLREERERARTKKGSKKKGIKDVVAEDDFEVSIFLTETTTRHSLLSKHKHFHDTKQTKLVSSSGGRLFGATSEAPLDVDAAADNFTVELRQEESDDDVVLSEIPAAEAAQAEDNTRRVKRPRRETTTESEAVVEVLSDDQESNDQDEEEDLFVNSPGSEERDSTGPPPAKRHKDGTLGVVAQNGGDDKKKKLAMDISYEGFSIYGRVLCLVVKRRETSSAFGTTKLLGNKAAAGTGQNMMENFIVSTQVPAGQEV
ncbi:uncharacterized protein B0I36DRAFT_39051 [Microdochium trichocladiopsis]|uniref:Uncharacterized protein n=1 Tax=Microdochium trichocladiopsis TaxID=1682393 RepID=A0A9P8XUN2_9PEZI|nr:uncharacterized protein B0I36DRAFT_39051 [Microdochium trichocladiopsis]KAH7018413.1 hypothetical protein B0I36DRAFT_39051 [Microdochium trichocladiopsis]